MRDSPAHDRSTPRWSLRAAVAAGLVGVATVTPAWGRGPIGLEKLTAGDGEPNERFGSSVSLSGDAALVGAFFENTRGTRAGAAYVFRQTKDGWVEEAKLTAGDGEPNDEFGLSVFLSGDVALIGAPYEDELGPQAGAVYVFRRTESGWVEEAKLTASDGEAGDRFGPSVSLSGDVALIGARGDDERGLNAGAAYIFRRTEGGWVEEAKLTASDAAPGAWAGLFVSLSGDVALVGSPFDDERGPAAGAAHVFRHTGDKWVEEAKLTAGDAEPGDTLGFSVWLSGDVAVVGAPREDQQGSDAGAAYVFRRTGDGWVEEGKLTAGDGEAGDWFGVSVSMSASAALVGAVFEDERGPDAGAAYVFRVTQGVWIETTKLTAGDGESLDNFGSSVWLSDGMAIVGAWRENERGADAGAAYVGSIVTCPGDLDDSGAVDSGDILAILSAWGNKGGPEDLDESGAVDFGDILIVLEAWGPCP